MRRAEDGFDFGTDPGGDHGGRTGGMHRVDLEETEEHVVRSGGLVHRNLKKGGLISTGAREMRNFDRVTMCDELYTLT
jgi:hypothetical protein